MALALALLALIEAIRTLASGVDPPDFGPESGTDTESVMVGGGRVETGTSKEEKFKV